MIGDFALMCRFLLLHTHEMFDPVPLLASFAEACKGKGILSRAQKDGWGYALLQPDDTWKLYKSLKPIWVEKDVLLGVPRS
ncbi:MAG TPA: hypothetical protein VGK87_00500, partial [Anaerolineae bacterium]